MTPFKPDLLHELRAQCRRVAVSNLVGELAPLAARGAGAPSPEALLEEVKARLSSQADRVRFPAASDPATASALAQIYADELASLFDSIGL